jgi:predicted acetyltransferase
MLTDRLMMAPAREGDSGELEALLSGALHAPNIGPFLARVGIQNFREVRLRGELVAGFGYVPMGQWFGGANVPCYGITVVGVAPEQRGTGVGLSMLRMMLEELQREGIPLSSLYPATVSFYKRVGFERAGYRLIYELPLNEIEVRESDASMVPVTESDYPTLRELYERRARLSPGNLERPEWMWQRKLQSDEQRYFRYLVTRDGAPEGYLIYRQGDTNTPISVVDSCVLTPEAGRRLLKFFAGHRSMIESVTWAGGPLDPFAYLLREPMVAVARSRVKTTLSLDWMLRLVDVSKALALRGYPTGLNAELHLDVRDDILPSNEGRLVLEIAGGRGEVRPGGQGRIRLDVRDLAALYSSFMSPAELRTLGTLDGPDADLALGGAVFAGPRPWMADMF